MTEMDFGYNLIEASEIRDGGIDPFDNQMSIVRFLQVLQNKEDIPSDVTVRGFDELLYASNDRKATSELIKNIMMDSVNHLMQARPIIQFIISGDLQEWEPPIIKYKNEQIHFQNIFGGSLDRKGVHHYHAEINIVS